MKIALITDQHLDGRKGSLAFWNYFQRFYDDVFFPTLEKENIKVVFDLGDTFDNRKSMDFNTFHRVRENYFERLKDYEVHMLLGNHCTYYKNTNRINSPELLLENYQNIRVYSEPKEILMGKKVFLMLPWINKENQEEVFRRLETSEADICCGHLELNGFEITPGMKMDHGMDPQLFHRFKRVWSGHYHHKSKRGNVQYLGNPYQMFWNDYKDPRGFHIYDTDTDELKFVKNPYEIFHKIYYNDIEKNYEDFDVSPFKDSFVKIIVEEKKNYSQFDSLLDNLYRVGAADIKIVETLVDETDNEDIEVSTKDTLTLLNEYIDEIDVGVDKNRS
jgi:DNA repair exonuclease SbcCD nuclease subunit